MLNREKHVCEQIEYFSGKKSGKIREALTDNFLKCPLSSFYKKTVKISTNKEAKKNDKNSANK